MDEELRITRRELADRLSLSEGTLRQWEEVFSEFMTSPPGEPGKKKVYSENDALVLSVIDKLRKDKKLSYEDIRVKLPEELRLVSLDVIPDAAPDEEDQAQEPSRQLVAFDLYMTAVRAHEASEAELNATKAERDRLLEEKKELQGELDTQRERAAEARKEAKMRQEHANILQLQLDKHRRPAHIRFRDWLLGRR